MDLDELVFWVNEAMKYTQKHNDAIRESLQSND